MGIARGTSYLIPAILKTVLLPPLLTYYLFRISPFHLPLLLRSFFLIASFPALYILRSHYSTYRHAIAARRMSAEPIPRVGGRYPLNIDVMLDWARSGSEEEVGRMMVLLGRRYGGTYNTRVLGEDQVCRCHFGCDCPKRLGRLQTAGITVN